MNILSNLKKFSVILSGIIEWAITLAIIIGRPNFENNLYGHVIILIGLTIGLAASFGERYSESLKCIYGTRMNYFHCPACSFEYSLTGSWILKHYSIYFALVILPSAFIRIFGAILAKITTGEVQWDLVEFLKVLPIVFAIISTLFVGFSILREVINRPPPKDAGED